MFSLTGQVNGQPATVTWLGPDRLEGDEALVARIRAAVATGDEVAASPTSSVRRADLEDPFTAMLTILAQFEDGATASGDVPPSDEPFDPRVIY